MHEKMNSKALIKYKKILLALAIFVSAVVLERLCFKATAGFRPYKILSDLPLDDCYGPKSLPDDEKIQIETILDQPFHYIGHGGCVYCFASEDNKYVIKFFKHQHLSGHHMLEHVPLGRFYAPVKKHIIDGWHAKKAHKRKDFLFTSFELAKAHLPKETALIHLQLSRKGPFSQEIKLYDKIGCVHKIALNKAEFILQRRAELLIPYLIEKEKIGHLDEGQSVIDSLFALIQKRCAAPLLDRDLAVDINFGVVDGMAVEIDTGSFSLLAQAPTQHFINSEIKKVADNLYFSLRKAGAPTLARYVEQSREKLSQSPPHYPLACL